MRAWMLAVVCLAACGCRTDPDIVLLERENRLLEDRIYELEDLVDKYQSGLESCRRQQAPGAATDGATGRAAATIGTGQVTGPALSLPEPKPAIPPEPPIPQAPVVEIPVPGVPSAVERPIPPAPAKARVSDVPAPAVTLPPPPVAKPRQAPHGRRNPNAPVPPEPPSRPQPPPPSARSGSASSTAIRPVGSRGATLAWVDNRQVHHVTLGRLATSGFPAEGRAGHQGIALLVEPRDAQGRLLRAAAPLSIVVLDKELSGPGARVGRWDFPSEQAASLWRRTPTGDGLYVELPWPDAPPAHGQLKVFVRFTTDDGRRLEAERDVEVQLAGSAPSGWSARVGRPAPDPAGSCAPLWEPPQPAPEPVSPPGEAAPLAREPAAAPVALPVQAPVAPAETALQRPVWSPHRR